MIVAFPVRLIVWLKVTVPPVRMMIFDPVSIFMVPRAFTTLFPAVGSNPRVALLRRVRLPV